MEHAKVQHPIRKCQSADVRLAKYAHAPCHGGTVDELASYSNRLDPQNLVQICELAAETWHVPPWDYKDAGNVLIISWLHVCDELHANLWLPSFLGREWDLARLAQNDAAWLNGGCLEQGRGPLPLL